MAQLQLQPIGNDKKRYHASELKIDMTPLVDLGFLLITFFIFTTTMSDPMVTNLYMPKDGEPMDLGKSAALTVLLSENDKVYCYEGDWLEAVRTNKVVTTSYDVQHGLGKIIRAKQKSMSSKRNDLMLLMKPLDKSSYKNVIDALDEAAINNVTRYAIVDAEPFETSYATGAN